MHAIEYYLDSSNYKTKDYFVAEFVCLAQAKSVFFAFPSSGFTTIMKNRRCLLLMYAIVILTPLAELKRHAYCRGSPNERN